MKATITLPKRYHVHLRSPNELLVIDLKRKDLALIDISRALLIRNELKSNVAYRILRVLYSMTEMRAVPRTVTKNRSITEFLPF